MNSNIGEVLGNNNVNKTSATPMAVVGLGCHYPGAGTPRQFWENILGRRREFRRFLDQRLPVVDYYDPDPNVPDKIYISRAAYIDGFEFDWAGRRIPKKTFDGTDIVQWLALDVAERALLDAGYDRDTLPRDRMGVILGNSLTGEQSRANTMRLRWPFVQKAMRKAADAIGLSIELQDQFLEVSEEIYKSVFPQVNEDTLQGGLSNTVAGRVANYFDLHGGAYVVDGACSSSLLAVCTAATQLANYDLDVALAGGVDISLDTFELIGFAKTSALAKGDMHVYDRRGAGFLPGEGCGFVVLKRLPDALAAGDEIYGVLRGWGISSDGKGGITAPSSDGQATALLRAYAKAGYSPHTLDFIEGHGTGTARGDRTELEGIAKAMQAHGEPEPRSCGMTSLKSIVGHTKAAAGVGAFIKAICAVNRRVLPPTAGCTEPNAVFETTAHSLYPILQGEVASADRKLRAGVSAMGFGGINSHVTVESPDAPPSTKLAPAIEERALLASSQQSELFVFGAESVEQLLRRIEAAADTAMGLSLSDLTDYAAELGATLPSAARARATIVASQTGELVERLRGLASALRQGEVKAGQVWQSAQLDSVAGFDVDKTRLGFLLPGQGSQRLNVGRELVERYTWARELVERADQIAQEEIGRPISPVLFRPLDRTVDDEQLEEWKQQLSSTELAQPAICLVSLLYLRHLNNLGLTPSVVGGHSLGELGAFYATGAFDDASLLRLAAIRGRVMAAASNSTDADQGAMASVMASEQVTRELIGQVDGYVDVANLNAPEQTVVTGAAQAIDEVIRLAQGRGIDVRRLPVSGAFHSAFMQHAAEELKTQMPIGQHADQLSVSLWSSMTGERVAVDCDLHEHFSAQMVSTVDFVKLVRSMQADADLLIEVGPGRVLSGLAGQIAGDRIQCLPVASRVGADRELNRLLAQAFVHGVNVNWSALYDSRLVRPFKPVAERSFIDNPCERPFADVHVPNPVRGVESQGQQPVDELNLLNLAGVDQTIVQTYLSKRANFLSDVVKADINSFLGAPLADLSASAPTDRSKPQPAPASQPVAPVNVAANETVVSARPTVDDVLKRLVKDYTGFEPESISMQLRLLDDLNLDSIKAGQLIDAFAREFGIAGQLNAAELANATLAEIAALVGDVHDAAVPSAQGAASASLASRVLRGAAELTGFSEDSLSLQLRLLDDLNLDSIKAGQLVSELARDAGVTEPLDAAQFANATLAELVDVIERNLGMGSASPAAPQPQAGNASQWLEERLFAEVEDLTGFSRESLSPDVRLLDDLNLDSIKAGQLISNIASEAGVSGQLEAAQLANASLREIIEAISQLSASSASRAKSDVQPSVAAAPTNAPALSQAPVKDWVRNFVVECVPQPLATGRAVERDFANMQLMIVCDDEAQQPLIGALGELARGDGAQSTTVATYASLASGNAEQGLQASHLIGVLPDRTSEASHHQRLQSMVARLHRIVTAAVAVRAKRVTFVQFGNSFGMFEPPAGPELCCAMSFARSFSLEHAELNIHVVDLPAEMAPAAAAQHVLNELGTEQPFTAAAYTTDGTRFVQTARVQQPALNAARSIDWSADDVILVTGGAKGITAECALALAAHTNAKFALVGSSPESSAATNPEISATLQRFEQLGVGHRYYGCNLTDAGAVAQLVKRVGDELGPVSALVHGAGLNKVRLIEQVSAEEALAEVSPKVLGIDYLLDALAPNPPRLVVGFASIIGVTGMPGNSWYAFSNEYLDVALRDFSRRHAQTSVVSIAYSVWGETGMGHRTGAVNNLGKMGVGAISTEQGVRRFVELCNSEPEAQQVIVAGPLGGIPTWRGLRRAMVLPDDYRFVEELVSIEPGVELTARARLTLERDQYLKDHDFRGSYLFPTVFGVEAMAQAASLLVGRDPDSIVAFEQLDLSRPIVVSPGRGQGIELHVMADECDARSRQTVRVGIRCEQTGYTADHFSARIVFDANGNESTAPMPVLLEPPLSIDAKQDLYGDFLFQGRLFQQMGAIHQVSEEKVVLRCTAREPVPADLNGFEDGDRVSLISGDPFYRDVLLQSVQLPATPDIVLPVGIGRVEFYGDRQARSGVKIVTATLKNRQGRDYFWDVVAADESGQVSERLIDYQVRIVNDPDRNNKSSIRDLLARKKAAAESVGDEQSVRESIVAFAGADGAEPFPSVAMMPYPALGQISKAERHAIELPLIRRAVALHLDEREFTPASEGQWPIDVRWQPDGKPQLVGDVGEHLDISLTHDSDYCLCVVGRHRQGCDLEPVASRSRIEWLGLLGEPRRGLLAQLEQLDGSLDRAGTRIWCAAEAVRKASGTWNMTLELHTVNRGMICLRAMLDSSAMNVLTAPMQFSQGGERVLALVFYPNDQALNGAGGNLSEHPRVA